MAETRRVLNSGVNVNYPGCREIATEATLFGNYADFGVRKLGALF